MESQDMIREVQILRAEVAGLEATLAAMAFELRKVAVLMAMTHRPTGTTPDRLYEEATRLAHSL